MTGVSLAGFFLAGLLGMTPARVVQVTTGNGFSCALLDDGAVKCWGVTGAMLGRGGQNSPTEIPADIPRINFGTDASGAYRRVAALASDWFHSCAIMADDGSVKCWGNLTIGGQSEVIGNREEEMGNGLPPVRLGPGDRARSLDINTYTGCVILEDDTVKCWGRNREGQLGQGDSRTRLTYDNTRGDIPPINLGTDVKARKIAVGENHVCALLDQGEEEGIVKCWGDNAVGGYLGTGERDPRGVTPESMGDALPRVNLGEDRHAVDLDAGFYHTCALLDDGSIKCWGLNALGQLGIGSENAQGPPGTLPLRPVNLGRGVTAIRLGGGGWNSCAILTNQTVKCWGQGTNGEVGNAALGNSGVKPEQMGDALRPINLGRAQIVESVSVTSNHACAVLGGGRVKCWGRNDTFQLGLGDRVHRSAPHQFGDALPFLNFGSR